VEGRAEIVDSTVLVIDQEGEGGRHGGMKGSSQLKECQLNKLWRRERVERGWAQGGRERVRGRQKKWQWSVETLLGSSGCYDTGSNVREMAGDRGTLELNKKGALSGEYSGNTRAHAMHS